jgi:hypothetical protein
MIEEAKRLYDFYTLRRAISTVSAEEFIRTDPTIATEAVKAFQLLPQLVKAIVERESAVDFMEKLLKEAVEDSATVRSRLKKQVGENELLAAENMKIKHELLMAKHNTEFKCTK